MTSLTVPIVGSAGDKDPSVNTPVLDRSTLKEQFDISEEFGFVSESPLAELPEYFKPWNDIALNLQELIKQKRVRTEVENLPLLEHNRLSSKAEWEAAHVFLAFITQGYVWQEGDEGIPEVLPKAIAVPYYAVSQHLQITANVNLFNLVLNNWRARNDREDMCLENLETILTMAGGREEQWFFLTTVMVEKECGAALYAVAEAQQAVYDQDDGKLEKALAVIEGAVLKMVKQLERMYDGVTPHVFYDVIRRFISGWTAPAFKAKGLDGLIYEGISDIPIGYPGATAAESSTLPALDAALGISHRDPEELRLKDLKKYTPPKHVKFVSAIARGPSIQNYVMNRRGSEVEMAYNKCLEAVQLFRNTHLKMVTRFIVIPSRRGTRGTANSVIGTGGTVVMVFLKGLRDRTVEAFLYQKMPESTQTSRLPSNATIAVIVAVGAAIGSTLYWKLK